MCFLNGTNKQNRDRLGDGRADDSPGGVVRGQGLSEKEKRTHGQGHHVVTAGGGGYEGTTW